MTINEIRKEVMKIKTRDELDEIHKATIVRLSQLEEAKAVSFTIRDRVEFDHNGSKIEGKILKINSKTIKVMSEGLVWDISPSLLNKLN